MTQIAQRTFSDAVVTAITCDDNTCLCLCENNVVSLPVTRIISNITWQEQSTKDIKEATGLDIIPNNVQRIFKIWLPNHTSPYIMTCTFVVQISKEAKSRSKPPSGKFANRLKWISESDLQKYYHSDALLIHILLEIFPKIIDKSVEVRFLYPIDARFASNIVEISEGYLMESSGTSVDSTVESSGLKAMQIHIYREFINMASPNVVLPYPPFAKFLTELGMIKDDTQPLFRAADISNRKFLSFREFLIILAVLEPATNHGGVSGEVRCRYIFRFFDKDNDGCINLNDLRDMVIYMRKLKNLPVDAPNVEKEHKAYCASLNIAQGKGLFLVDFLKYAGELKIRGLSQVLRLPKGVKTYLQSTLNKDSKIVSKLINMESVPKTINKIGDFEIAAHSVHIQRSGTMINVEDIWSTKGVSSVTTLQQANITRESRRLSCDINSQESISNDLIRTLRGLVILNKARSGNRGNRKEQFQWGNINFVMYAQKLIQVANLVKNVIKQEPRLLELRSPIYVMGDFHGNFGDLQYFERMFWPLGPGFCPCSLLFLGDYVDRGNFSMEIVTYLFCYKFLYPHKLYLLRGNHEIREIQKSFTFQTECSLKFGEKLGNEVWDAVNNVFDVMPLASVIDGKIFCCHGGIPPPWLCPVASAINSIPSPLPDPDVQSSLAWELMWNDPVREKQLPPEIDIEMKVNGGFAKNLKRGTAHIFNSDGLDRFLNINGYTHVVRAHEMVTAGYNVLLKGRLLTVFSSSKYSGQNNDAACLLIDNGKLRMMRLDTGNI